MQPDTTALKIARDLAAMLSGNTPSEQLQNSEIQENGPVQTQQIFDASPSAITSESQVQVVPLHTPSGSAIKFFCVHPSHRYALNLVPISTGFQSQVFSHCCINLIRIGWLQKGRGGGGRLHPLINEIIFKYLTYRQN